MAIKMSDSDVRVTLGEGLGVVLGRVTGSMLQVVTVAVQCANLNDLDSDFDVHTHFIPKSCQNFPRFFTKIFPVLAPTSGDRKCIRNGKYSPRFLYQSFPRFGYPFIPVSETLFIPVSVPALSRAISLP